VVPGAPSLQPIANASKADEYEVRWSASVSATGYTLEEADNSAFNQATVRYAGEALSYQVTGQRAGTWYYRVRAWSPAGVGSWSSTRSTQVDQAALSAPNLQGIGNEDGDGNYLVRWSSVPGAISYILERSGDPYFSAPVQVTSAMVLQFSVTDQPGGTWYYRVRAVGTGGKSPWSNSQSVVVIVLKYLPLLVRNVGTGAPGGAIVNGDFESGRTAWTESSLKGLPIIMESFPSYMTAHSGTWAAWLGGEDDEVSSIGQQITVPNGKSYLTYWHWIDSQDFCGSGSTHYDVANVVINGSVVDLYDLCLLMNTGSWTRHVVDLNTYAGQSVSLRIEVKTDVSLNSNLFVDDVSFQPSSAVEPGSEPSTTNGGPGELLPGRAQSKTH